MSQSLRVLEPPFTEEVASVLSKYPGADQGYVLKLFRVFANSLRFLNGKGVVNLLDAESPLTLRDRELVILRTTANRECEYEWGAHVSIFAEAAGLTEQQVRATLSGRSESDGWSASEASLLDCVDDLCEAGKIRGDNYALFQHYWTLEQQLEIMALCGNYHTISFIANSARLSPEEFSARFQDAAAGRRVIPASKCA